MQDCVGDGGRERLGKASMESMSMNDAVIGRMWER